MKKILTILAVFLALALLLAGCQFPTVGTEPTNPPAQHLPSRPPSLPLSRFAPTSRTQTMAIAPLLLPVHLAPPF